MKFLTKVFSILLLLTYLTTSTYAAVETVSCDSDGVYAANSCDQCFTGGSVSAGDNKGLLSDVWENNSNDAQILFKEEQEMPQIISLGGSSWSEVTASDDIKFWQYTNELENLYDEDNLGYKLDAGSSVKWLESSLGSAYQLVSSNVPEGGNTGLLVYDIAVHGLSAGGELALEAEKHRECVLYTSGDTPDTPVVPQPPVLPETGAEHILLAFAALLLGFGFLKFRRKA